MDEYSSNDLALDLLAGIFTEQERVRAEEGEDAFLDKVLYQDVVMVGELWGTLNNAGYTDIQIQAEIHMRQYTDQGFTHISFE